MPPWAHACTYSLYIPGPRELISWAAYGSLCLKGLEIGVSSSRVLRAGCCLLLTSLNGSSGTTSPPPPDERDTAVRTHWWHTTTFSCPPTHIDPCPQSSWMPCRKQGVRLSFLPEQADEACCPLNLWSHTCGADLCQALFTHGVPSSHVNSKL